MSRQGDARRARPTTAGARPTPLAAVVLLLACVLGCTTPPEGQVVVAVGSTVEQRVLAALTQHALEQAGVTVALTDDRGSTTAVRAAVLEGEGDVYWDYTAAAWTLALGRSQPSPDPAESFEAVRAADVGNGLRWLGPSRVNATLSLFVRAAERPPGPEGTMTWLAGRLAVVEGGLCADAEFLRRPAGWPAVADVYAVSGDLARTGASEAKAITAVARGDCYAAVATATSPTAVNAGLVAVIDDREVFPAFVAAPVVAQGSPADTPEVAVALERVAAALDTATLASLNARVVAGADPSQLAEEVLGPS